VRAAARRATPTGELPDTTPSPAADHRDLDLADCVARLAPKQRQVVAYHYLAGLPYADIAALVGGSAAAARRTGADGIAALRTSYPGLNATKGAPR
jgi:DNA-directed RNA polymerase specialized sigma24 family protein